MAQRRLPRFLSLSSRERSNGPSPLSFEKESSIAGRGRAPCFVLSASGGYGEPLASLSSPIFAYLRAVHRGVAWLEEGTGQPTPLGRLCTSSRPMVSYDVTRRNQSPRTDIPPIALILHVRLAHLVSTARLLAPRPENGSGVSGPSKSHRLYWILPLEAY